MLSNATDLEGDTLTANGLTIATGNGTLADNGDGTWSYTPTTNDDEAVSFNYTISDSAGNVAGVATLDIIPVNDTPTSTPVVLTPVAEDTVRLITQAELLVNAADIDSASLTATNLQASTGTLTDNGDGTWNFTPSANDDTDVSFTYTVSVYVKLTSVSSLSDGVKFQVP